MSKVFIWHPPCYHSLPTQEWPEFRLYLAHPFPSVLISPSQVGLVPEQLHAVKLILKNEILMPTCDQKKGLRKKGLGKFTLMCLCCIWSIWLFKRILINLTQSLVEKIWGGIRQKWKKCRQCRGKYFLSNGSWLAAWPGHSCWEWVEREKKGGPGGCRPLGRGTMWEGCFQTGDSYFQQGSAHILTLPQSISTYFQSHFLFFWIS